MHLQMIGRGDWTEINSSVVIMIPVPFENHGPAKEARIIPPGWGIKERNAVASDGFLASKHCPSDGPRPALILPNLDPESLWLPSLLV
jgi:hypothetical protein